VVSGEATTGDVRAVVENLLGTYARVCDERDIPGLAALLSDAVVTFGDADPVSGAGELGPALVGMGEYDSVFAADQAHWRFKAHTVRRDWFQEPRA
jgi:hypothetical protein